MCAAVEHGSTCKGAPPYHGHGRRPNPYVHMHMRARVHGLAYMPLYPVACACSGGFSMLGLGDIVMPGLLLSYAVRFDYDTHLTAKKGYGPAAVPCPRSVWGMRRPTT